MTDSKTIDVTTMVLNGKINTKILAIARKYHMKAIGMSGIDSGFIRAHRREVTHDKNNKSIHYGFVGDIDSINPELIFKRLDDGFIPMISPLACDDSGIILNINADTVAASIAAEISAEKLIFISSAPGILEDSSDNC